jgi:hypothetical protein
VSGIDPVKGYLLDEVTQQRFDFQFNFPEFSLKRGAEWTAKSPRGSSYPRRHFSHSKGGSFALTLQFVRTTADGTDLEDKRRAIEALPHPDYDDTGRLRGGPHIVRVALGPWRTLRCVVTDVEIDFGPYFDAQTLQPGEFFAHLAFEEVPLDGDLSYDQVRNGRA